LALRLQLLQRGLGVGFVNRPMLLDRPPGTASLGHLAEISTTRFPGFERKLGIYYKKHQLLTPTASRFLDLCRKHWV